MYLPTARSSSHLNYYFKLPSSRALQSFVWLPNWVELSHRAYQLPNPASRNITFAGHSDIQIFVIFLGYLCFWFRYENTQCSIGKKLYSFFFMALCPLSILSICSISPKIYAAQCISPSHQSINLEAGAGGQDIAWHASRRCVTIIKLHWHALDRVRQWHWNRFSSCCKQICTPPTFDAHGPTLLVR